MASVLSFTSSLIRRLQSTNTSPTILHKPWKIYQGRRCYGSELDDATAKACEAANKVADNLKREASIAADNYNKENQGSEKVNEITVDEVNVMVSDTEQEVSANMSIITEEDGIEKASTITEEDGIEKVSETTVEGTKTLKKVAQDAAGKVQQVTEGTWESVKDTSEKIKNTVVDKAEASADCAKGAIKDRAAKIDRTINPKK